MKKQRKPLTQKEKQARRLKAKQRQAATQFKQSNGVGNISQTAHSFSTISFRWCRFCTTLGDNEEYLHKQSKHSLIDKH